MKPLGSCCAGMRTAGPVSTLALFVVVAMTAGCGGPGQAGSGPGSGSGPIAGESTSVTVLVSSAANDQLSEFNLNIDSLTLTSQSGKAVNLLPATGEHAEFIHLNSSAEPLLTVSVPQDVYNSATATIGTSNFTCLGRSTTGGLATSTYAYGYTPDSQVSVQVPVAISVSGSSMGLSLKLLVSSSASWTEPCAPPPSVGTYKITPTFSLSPVSLSPQPTNMTNGKLSGLSGMVASVSSAGNGFTVASSDDSSSEISQTGAVQKPSGPLWQVETNSSTQFQGVGGLSALAPGIAVEIDGEIQSGGSLLATRVEVDDPDSTNLSVYSGPLLAVYSSDPVLATTAIEEQGYLPTRNGQTLGGAAYYSYGDAAFQISGQLANLSKLPFAATFDATNMVAGQMISISTHATSLSPAPVYFPATTITLVPQTIDGTISEVSTNGGFSTYTVSLASYDLFPTMAVQAGQTTLLNDPGAVVVYADSNTNELGKTAPVIGAVMRFTGLVFNDNGTLRMDCTQINDGVPE